MTNVLLPTDFSESSLAAMRFAVDAFGTDKARYVLVHSIGDRPRDPVLPDVHVEERNAAMEKLKAFGERCRDLAPDQPLKLDHVVEQGAVFHAIEQVYLGEEINVVVMGARGEGEASRWGSNTATVVAECKRPVVVVPADWSKRPLERILYAEDRAAVRKQRTFEMLSKIARRYDAEITLLHVRENMDEPLPPSVVEQHEQWFRGLRYITATIPGNDVVEELGRLTDDRRFGMLVVLHRDLNWVERLFHRSIAKRLSVHAELPTLVLHEH